MSLSVVQTSQFKRDFKLAVRQGKDIELLRVVARTLAEGGTLPTRNHDHALTGEWRGYRECHIQPDWLLIYRVDDSELLLVLTRTGTHAALFGS